MKNKLLIAIAVMVLCSCDKITIEENEIVGTYWYEHSHYVEYIENGKKVSSDYINSELDGSGAYYWYFGDNGERISYCSIDYMPISYYYTGSYSIDLKNKTLNTDSKTYIIRKFTDSELIIEYRGSHYSGDPNALFGNRFERIYPKKGAFDNYIPYEELPDEDKNPSN